MYLHSMQLLFRTLRVLASLRAACFGASLLAGSISAGNIRAEDQNWDRFRGPNGAGQSDATSIPAEWKRENYLWKRSLAGLGHSSPVVWGGRIFVTSADPKTAEQIVSAFDAGTGAPLWERRFAGSVHEQHAQNSFASSTPAVDAERLYVSWRAGSTITLAALSHEGRDVWQRDVAQSDEKFGFGASPVLAGGIVCVVNDIESASNLTGVDAVTGEIRWQVPRPSAQSAYSTPCLLDTSAGKKLLVMTSTAGGLTLADPADGKIAWQMLEKDLPERCVSSPIVAGGMVLISCGRVNVGMHLIAVRPSEGSAPPAEVYRIREGVPNVPTPVVAGDLLFLWQDKGIVSCCELATGKQIWRQRIGGNFNSSPVRVGDRVYCASREGEMVVIAAAKEYKLLSRFPLGEPVNATPAIARDRMFLRTDATLMCIGEPTIAGE